MIYAIKKQNESNERVFSRFKKLVQRSRILPEAKKSRFFTSKPTKKFIREAAVIKARHRKKREKSQFYS